VFRADLQQAGVGDGDHAFVVQFPETLDETSLNLVKVMSVSTRFERRQINPLSVEEVPEPPVPEAFIEMPEAFDPLAEQRPLFILGAARSGTSALAQGLLRSGIYEGYEEGHLFDLAARMVKTAHDYYDDHGDERQRGTLIARLPLRFFNEAIKEQFRTVGRLCFRGARWLDKTPRREMILCAPLLQEIWPQARFVFMKRRGIENVASRLRKFPEISFADHCRDWSEVMGSWRTVRATLGDAALEIEQLEIATDPASVVDRLATFLELSGTHAARLTRTLSVERPERTADRFGGVLDLDGMDWSTDAKLIFEDMCTLEMNAYGYSVDMKYYAKWHTG
jgi:hypothetical protein